MKYNVDWEKTVENIEFLMVGRTHKKNFAELFGVEGRAVQRRLSTASKQGLPIGDLMMLADYLGCDMMDLIILQGEQYIAPSSDWKTGSKKVEVEDKSPEDVNNTFELRRSRKEKYEIRNLSEFLLYLPLIEEEWLRDVIYRCFGDLTYDRTHYIMTLLSNLYKHIPDCAAKRDADMYRDNVLRVKGAPRNNLFGFDDEEYNKYYYANLQRYYEEGNSGLWSYDYKKEQIEKRRKDCLGL